jgi:hypothetical protein
MSDIKGSADNKDTGKQTSGQDDEFVAKSAYVEVSNDMHKYKSELKEARAKLIEKEEAIKAKEQDELAKQKRFEELFNAEKKRADELYEQKNKERQNFLNAQKRSALISELGALEKNEYIRFANLDAIEVREDGEIDVTSLKKVADSFKQEHSVLLKKAKVTTLPNNAPIDQTQQTKEPKTFSDYKNLLKQVQS